MPTRTARLLLVGALAALAPALSAAALQNAEPGDAPPPGEAECGDAATLAVAVLDDSGLIAMPTATVVVRWGDAVERPVREPSNDEGRLLLCVPPGARQAALWAEFGDASSEERVVDLEPGAAHEVELRLVFAEGVTGRLVGRVRDARTRRPVAAATVSLTGRREEVQSDRRGQFVLSGLRVGPHEMSIRHLGYAPLTHRVMVSRGHTTEVDVRLSPDPVELEPLVATATRIRRLETRGFYERKYWGELTGLGRFFTVQDIERRNPFRVTDLIADVPGVRVRCGRGSRCKVYNRRISTGFGGAGCELNVYVDGMHIIRSGGRNPASVNEFALPIEIGGIEVYPGAASLPAEFSGSAGRCGAVVIWTR